MGDLLGDYPKNINSRKYSEALSLKKKLYQTYIKSISKQDIINSNTQEIIGTAPNFMFAPNTVRGVNNLPFVMHAYQEISANTETLGLKDALLISLLKKIDLDAKEGIMPASRVEAKLPEGYNIMSDYYTLCTIDNYIKKKQ
jgi:hypothetical protein